jgi:hypothetical protein
MMLKQDLYEVNYSMKEHYFFFFPNLKQIFHQNGNIQVY